MYIIYIYIYINIYIANFIGDGIVTCIIKSRDIF